MWNVKAKINFGEELDAEAKAWSTIWSAGQGSATIKDTLPTKDLIARLTTEFKVAIERQATYLERYGNL